MSPVNGLKDLAVSSSCSLRYSSFISERSTQTPNPNPQRCPCCPTWSNYSSANCETSPRQIGEPAACYELANSSPKPDQGCFWWLNHVSSCSYCDMRNLPKCNLAVCWGSSITMTILLMQPNRASIASPSCLTDRCCWLHRQRCNQPECYES